MPDVFANPLVQSYIAFILQTTSCLFDCLSQNIINWKHATHMVPTIILIENKQLNLHSQAFTAGVNTIFCIFQFTRCQTTFFYISSKYFGRVASAERMHLRATTEDGMPQHGRNIWNPCTSREFDAVWIGRIENIT